MKTSKSQLKNEIINWARFFYFFDADEEILNPSDLDITKNRVMLFDNVRLEYQTTIKKYFCKGRHNNVNIFDICSVTKQGGVLTTVRIFLFHSIMRLRH